VEALRENRNAIHIYTFADGRGPAEPAVAGFLSDVQDAHPGSAVRPAAAKSRARPAASRKKPRTSKRAPRTRTAR
jgi:hypothetical protein